MKTEELVSILATGLEPVDTGRARRRLRLAWTAGMLASVVLLAGGLRFNPALSREALVPMFWVRAAFCASLALLAVVAVGRLGRPGTRLGLVPAGLALPVLVMGLLAVGALLDAPVGHRGPLILGATARSCPWLIALQAAPLFLALLWAMRNVAPTRLRLAGAATGLAAGAGGALVYTLHCPELAAPFLSVWYVLGMLIPAALGAALGPRLLRW
jgi:hypothetical protein